MTAGMIKVPSIMPLRPPESGRKNIIHTNTPIELRTETRDTIIYYTINGMKPEPFKQIGIKCTYRYNKPFVLGEGKRAVKAMATSADGTRESSIVTKTFIVEQPAYSDEDGELQSSMQSVSTIGNRRDNTVTFMEEYVESPSSRNLLVSKKKRATSNAWGSVSKRQLTSTPDGRSHHQEGSEFRKPRTEPRFMSTRFGSNKATIATPDQSFASIDDGELRDRRGPEDKTQVTKRQQDTDYLKCIFCFAARPSDPFARFCAECGSPLPPLPQSRQPPPEGGKLVMCVSCHSMVPANTPTCIVCEVPMVPQWQPQASKKLLTKLVCRTCSTANPQDMDVCLTCEARLPRDAKQIYSGSSAPPVPKGDMGSFITCSKCARVNSSDARYCDWCGEKPSLYLTPIVCSRCEASNKPFSRFCNSCGCTIEPPPRETYNMTTSVIGMLVEKETIQQRVGQTNSATWLPVQMPSSFAEKADKATSTVGLFYPSSQAMNSQVDLDSTGRTRLEASRDRRPALAAVSPGHGYWRQQMDHICSHLRAHAQNNPDFRSIIGEPRLGKIITAAVHEDLDGEEVTLTVTYARRDGKENWKEKSKAVADGLRALTLGTSMMGSRDSLNSSQTSLRSTQRSTTKTKKAVKKKNKENATKGPKLKESEKQLIRELGAKGKGREEEIERLIDEGASPDCETTDGTPLIVHATTNKHLDCIGPLVNAGANVNAKNLSKGNTALHAAVLLGGDGVKYVDALLGLGAKADVKNDVGQTPYDLAVSSGHDSIAQRFTSNVGDELLQKLTKPQKTKYTAE